MDSKTDIELATIIWDYMVLGMPLQKADVVIALGSHDEQVAHRAAELYLVGYAPVIVMSGGYGRLTPKEWGMSEAAWFAKIAIERGVPESAVLIEDQSTNTGENIRFSYELLAEKNIPHATVIVVQKTYMERRTYATFAKQWPDTKASFVVASPTKSLLETATEAVSMHEIISVMVGDLERIKKYPAKGFQIEQDIPDNVWNAFEELVARGYDQHLMKD